MRRLPRNYRYPGYVFPFITKKISPGRIDQGKDYTGEGVITAIGDARILKTGAPGWPEGGGVLYELLSGPYKGHNIFVYEGVDAARYLKPGMTVRAGQPIATFRKGGSIEIGFADRNGVPLSHGEYFEGKETIWGKRMQQFLGHLASSPVQTGHIAGAPSFPEQLGEQILHPGQTAAEDASAVGGVAGDVLSGIFGAIHPEALMLNIGLIGGGAFLVYYGAALMLGVKKPVATPARAVAMAPK